MTWSPATSVSDAPEASRPAARLGEVPLAPSAWSVLFSSSVLKAAERAAGLAAQYHRATLRGAERLPEGGALLVGNHGYFGYETPIFFYLLKQATSRYPVGLAERGFFRLPLVRDLLPMLGGVRGTREEALRLLREQKLVVCYPGGAYEVFKEPSRRYALAWHRSTGFGKVAAKAGAPVVPFAAFGVDDTFAVLPKRTLSIKLTGDAKYEVPVGVGIGPLPLPVRFTFVVGEPMVPPLPGAPSRAFASFRDDVARCVRRLLLDACHG